MKARNTASSQGTDALLVSDSMEGIEERVVSTQVRRPPREGTFCTRLEQDIQG